MVAQNIDTDTGEITYGTPEARILDIGGQLMFVNFVNGTSENNRKRICENEDTYTQAFIAFQAKLPTKSK